MKAMMEPVGLTGLKQEMDRLFDRLWDRDLPDVLSLAEWTPRMDVAETKDRFVVKLEVPGIEPRDIQVTLRDQILTIRGEKKREEEEKDSQFYRLERAYGGFVRTFRVPAPVDPKKVAATFKHGLLIVMLTKLQSLEGVSIPITLA